MKRMESPIIWCCPFCQRSFDVGCCPEHHPPEPSQMPTKTYRCPECGHESGTWFSHLIRCGVADDQLIKEEKAI